MQDSHFNPLDPHQNMNPFPSEEDELHRNLSQFALQSLEAVVAIDSCSDENSTTIPSTVGQKNLAKHLSTRFSLLGAEVEIDEYANVIAHYPGQGRGAQCDPLVFMIHLDTAMGTQALPCLNTHAHWEGDPVKFSTAQSLVVSVDEYPCLKQFVEHTLVYGSGLSPFGLDDKLGLTHLLSVAWLLQNNIIHDYPPLYFIGRPDEEIGRDDALIHLAQKLASWGIKRGYTVDGIEAFEVNTANFNAAEFRCSFPRSLQKITTPGFALRLEIKGVNTHGATAQAEGHRSALRFVCELWQTVKDHGIKCCDFIQNQQRDCDGDWIIWVDDLASAAYLKQSSQKLVAAHVNRGASIEFHDYQIDASAPTLSYDDHLTFILVELYHFMFQGTSHKMWAEDSSAWEGYSQPFALIDTKRSPAPSASQIQTIDKVSLNDSIWTLRFRLRDFTTEGLQNRIDQLNQWQSTQINIANECSTHHHYQNMYQELQEAPELITWAQEAALRINQESHVLPIRGGTGIEPFLEAGIKLANLGTGYFAPESEKECTSTEMMVHHALWLLELIHISTETK
jgi:di/tripeptidase